MDALRPFLPRVAATLAAVFFLTTAVVPAAHARLVSTDEVAAAEKVGPTEARDKVLGFLARQDVQAQLRALGVSPKEAMARVQGLSDAEARELALKLPDEPAGQDALGTVLGVALVAFLVLLVTDILGFTDVFPFTRGMR